MTGRAEQTAKHYAPHRAEHHVGLKRLATAVALGIVASAQWSFVRTLRNDAFVDEATYISAGRLLHAAAGLAERPPSFATYFSGAPHLYPMLAGYADRVAGLEGARLVSSVCIMVAMLAVYVSTRHLFRSRLAGVSAATLFAVQAPVLFLARLATFDALSLALVSLAIALCALASTRARAWSAFTACALAGGCVGGAAAIKYASLLYAPCVVLLAALLSPQRKWWSGAVTAAGALLVAALLLMPGDPHDLMAGFLSTTVSRSAVSGGRSIDILFFAAQLGGVVALLAVAALALRSPSPKSAAIVLFLFALAAPINHARLHEFVSLQKHVAWSLLLLAPLAGAALARGAWWVREEFHHGRAPAALSVASLVCLIVVRLNVVPSTQRARALYNEWPNMTRRAYQVLRPIIAADTRILSEEPDLGWFYTGATMPYANWTHPYYFRYGGAVAKPTADSLARIALRDSYFDAVVLRFGPQATWARAIEQELLGLQPAYRLATRLPYVLADGPGHYEVWVRAEAPGAEAVR